MEFYVFNKTDNDPIKRDIFDELIQYKDDDIACYKCLSRPRNNEDGENWSWINMRSMLKTKTLFETFLNALASKPIFATERDVAVLYKALRYARDHQLRDDTLSGRSTNFN